MRLIINTILSLLSVPDLLLQAKDPISKITEERSSIIDQNKRPPQELDPRARNIEDVLILSEDHLYRMNYMDLIQVHRENKVELGIDCKRRYGWKRSCGDHLGDFGLLLLLNL
ncbi:hypothetical protein HN873_059606 [Arachis hypogaea]